MIKLQAIDHETISAVNVHDIVLVATLKTAAKVLI